MQKQFNINQPHLSLSSLPGNLSGDINIPNSPIGNILIFKTGIKTLADRLKAKRFLDSHPLISQWNVDIEDVDCVLRVVCTHLNHTDIIELVIRNGYYCEELI